MKKVGIVVVTYNRLQLLKEVVESLYNQTVKDYDIVVVNNGSTDGTLDWLTEQKGIIIITQENLGGAGGFYTGMKYVAEQGYKYCWLMDDDVICKPTALEELVKAVAVRDDIGFVCSNVLGIDGKPMNVPTIDAKLKENGYPDYMDLIEYGMIKVSTATFVSVLIPVNIVYEVGLPYKEYFIWGDDTEYTERISSIYPCYVVGRSKVIHKRCIQKGLNFCEETDPARIQMYYYKIRNIGHRLFLNGFSRRQFYFDNLKQSIRFLLNGKYVHCKIVIKALASTKSFYPCVDYPHNSSNNQ